MSFYEKIYKLTEMCKTFWHLGDNRTETFLQRKLFTHLVATRGGRFIDTEDVTR